MVNSMTGFASLGGQSEDMQWTWEIRSVNGRGLDIKARLPEGNEALEKGVKAKISKTNYRGSIGLSLRLVKPDAQVAINLDAPEFKEALHILTAVQIRAKAAGLQIEGVRAQEILSLTKEIVAATPKENVSADWQVPMVADFDQVLLDFNAAKQDEGAKLLDILQGQVNDMASLISRAQTCADTRLDAVAKRLNTRIAGLLADQDLDPDRLAQEMAILAVKSDVTEEIDRLVAHVAAARELFAQKGPVGRKLDFLMQEFNREANTLCSKSGSSELTRIGLDLKTVIDQMREQVQNVE